MLAGPTWLKRRDDRGISGWTIGWQRIVDAIVVLDSHKLGDGAIIH
jgi:hypothetical protein